MEGVHEREKSEYISSKEPNEVIMNCLLLLIILCCCSGNTNWNGGNLSRTNCLHDNHWSENNYARYHQEPCGCGMEREVQEPCGCGMEREVQEPCGCNVENSHKEPCGCGAERAQYPYIDLEPRTCGCEEKS